MKTLVNILILSVFFLSACEKVKTKETYYPDKSIKERWNITNEGGQELKNGLYESWHENGKKKQVFNYVDGKKHGAQKSFYKYPSRHQSPLQQEQKDNLVLGVGLPRGTNAFLLLTHQNQSYSRWPKGKGIWFYLQ